MVLLDIMMPDMTGYQVHEVLNAEMDELPPIIYLTAKSLPEDREMGMSLGAADFLIKPVTRGSLLDAIENNRRK